MITDFSFRELQSSGGVAVESHKDWIYVLCGPLLLYFYIIFGPSCVRLVRFQHQIYLVGFRK